jgi:DNA-directed RNA polymerase subunit N (RpoN/RPB10)
VTGIPLRREFPDKVKLAIIKRSMDSKGRICCEGCGQVLGSKKHEIDHKIAEALVVDKSKPLTADDGQLLGYCCHRGEGGKTAQDVADIARAKRREQRHLGIRKRSTMPGSRDSRWKKTFNHGTVLR